LARRLLAIELFARGLLDRRLTLGLLTLGPGPGSASRLLVLCDRLGSASRLLGLRGLILARVLGLLGVDLGLLTTDPRAVPQLRVAVPGPGIRAVRDLALDVHVLGGLLFFEALLAEAVRRLELVAALALKQLSAAR